jgi:hypothetical protein
MIYDFSKLPACRTSSSKARKNRLLGQAGKTKVLPSVPLEARKYHTLLIAEEHVDDHPASGEELILKGEAP